MVIVLKEIDCVALKSNRVFTLHAQEIDLESDHDFFNIRNRQSVWFAQRCRRTWSGCYNVAAV